MWHCGSLLVIIVTLALVANASSFTPVPVTKSIGGICNYGLKSALSDGDGQQSSPRQNQQETRMERASIAGADEIRKLDVNARTKRAMLAEAVEDRLFELVDDLDELVKKNGGLENLSDEVKEEAVEMAKQTKALQVQYDDLVTGKPSSLLDL